jgi:hypothetical protein
LLLTEVGGHDLIITSGFGIHSPYLQFDGISKSNLLSISKNFHILETLYEERKVYPHHT